MDSPRLSCLVTTRNAEPWIADCLASILNQQHVDYEALICDDASTDRTPDITESVILGNPRFTLLRNTERQSALPNLVKLVTLARGEIVTWIGGDDAYAQNGAFMRMLQEYDLDAECDTTYGNYTFEPPAERPSHIKYPPPERNWWDSWFFGSPLSWRKQLSLDSFRLEPEAYIDPTTGKFYQIAADLAIFYPIIARARRVVMIPDILYRYRVHDANDGILQPAAQMSAERRIRSYWSARDGRPACGD